jgi:iduronate 2-sulfatase
MKWIVAISAFGVSLALSAAEPKKWNVLFVAVDDLKPNVGCLGDPLAITPSMDALAKRGTAFTRAYCQQAVCSPSRSSVLTGCRPDTTQVYDLVTHFRKAIPDVVTLPQHFRENGYHSQGVGKIFHPGYDDKPSWSVPWEAGKGRGFGPEGLKVMADLKAQAKARGQDESRVRGLPVEAPEVQDDALQDGAIANRAIEILKSRVGQSQPFFLAVGFAKPHLPFVAPKKYWDLHDPKKFAAPSPSAPPEGAPPYAPQFGGELRQYVQIPKTGPVPPETAQKLIHGYYAATSYMDAQLGRVLAGLKEAGFAENTIVILWGDHGWHLGDHSIWCKHTNYEQATRAALLVSHPKQKVMGKTCEKLVEFVDMYPTLAELCGLALPKHLEGTSFAPLLDDPNLAWKPGAFSQYPRSSPETGPLMGYALRTERYRYVEWQKRKGGETVARELYDLQTDPSETKNLASEVGQKATLYALAKQLKAGWQKNLPPTK